MAKTEASSRIGIFWFGILAGLITCAVLTTGCRLVQTAADVPGNVVRKLTPGSQRPQGIPPAVLQVELQRIADEVVGRTLSAMDDYARIIGTDEARRQVLRWRVSMGAAVVTIVTGPNPQVNLLDFLALTTVTRIALEEIWVNTTDGPAFEPWLAASRGLEASAWELTEGVFTTEQQQEIRDAIRRWWDSNPETQLTFFVRPGEFSRIIAHTANDNARPGSVWSVVGLDPTVGLDPAVREVTQTRLFAERALYMVQRMPFMARWQVELLADNLVNEQHIAGVLTNTASLTESIDRLSRATESASATAALLPDRVTAERKAILEALEAQEGRLRELCLDINRTLVSGEAMASSFNTALITFDALMKRFGVGEPAPPDAPSQPEAAPAPPFNILDYAHTAEQIAAMARQLDLLIQESGSILDSPALDRRIGELDSLAERARADTKSVLNHAFLLATGLIVLVLAAVLIGRRVGRGV
jgi:hypothetical protein